MCETCGCGDPNRVPIEVQESLLADNDHQAAHNREHFIAQGVLAINLMGSPGSGKTAILEATAKAGVGDLRPAALSGDLATDNDAARLRAAGIPSRSITTGSACHLDARLVHHALHEFELDDARTLFIENVGNLVCPAIYDLGQAFNVVTLSVTEGEDKPLKYPVMFRAADLVLLTKVDLLPHLPGISIDSIGDGLEKTMPVPEMIPVSAVSGEGIDVWMSWLGDAYRRVAAGKPDLWGHGGHHAHEDDAREQPHTGHSHSPGHRQEVEESAKG
jgi:hydrogenase nickel incorporation protein HypB